MAEGAGRWIVRQAARAPHVCRVPCAGVLEDVWQCACGVLWRCTGESAFTLEADWTRVGRFRRWRLRRKGLLDG